jgi:hypothetical protein
MEVVLHFEVETVESETKPAIFRIQVLVVEVYPVVSCGTVRVMRKVIFCFV